MFRRVQKMKQAARYNRIVPASTGAVIGAVIGDAVIGAVYGKDFGLPTSSTTHPRWSATCILGTASLHAKDTSIDNP